MSNITITLTPEQLQTAIEALVDASAYRSNLWRMWKEITADDVLHPWDRQIAADYAEQHKERAAAMEDLADLFNRAYYAT